MKSDDKITLTLTVRDAIRAYMVLGQLNGSEDGLWNELSILLEDSNTNKYEKCRKFYSVKGKLSYYHSQSEIERVFLKKTEQQKKIKELEDTINKAKQQIEELKNDQ